MLAAFGILWLSDSPGVGSRNIPSEFREAMSCTTVLGWSHWGEGSLESSCLNSFQVKGWLGFLLHSSLQCGSRKYLSAKMGWEALEIVENNIKLYFSQVSLREELTRGRQRGSVRPVTFNLSMWELSA